MAESRDIIHVDVDAFFVAVERVLDPTLRGKPVIVGGDPKDRSVVSSASYEARHFGVRSAMPISQALRLCPSAICVRGNYAKYGEFSRCIRNILYRYAPVVEAASLDDFYLDYTGCRRLHGPPLVAGERMRAEVVTEVGVDITLGISRNRMVAKIASDLAKPRGAMEIWTGYEAAFLKGLPADRLPGVGPSTAESLRRYNLQTIGDIAALPVDTMQKAFGAWGAALWENAHGRDDTPVSDESGPPKSISRETTLRVDTDQREELRATLYSLVEHAARQLREEGLLARRVTVKVRYADFQSASACRTLPEPAAQDHIFHEVAVERMDYLLGRRRMRVRLIGVVLSGLTPATVAQGHLFADPQDERKRKFYAGLDKLREKFGFDIARVGPTLRLPQEEDEGANTEGHGEPRRTD